MRVSRGIVNTTSGLTVDADLDFLSTYQCKGLAAPASGEALRKGNKDIENAEVADAAAIAYAKLSLAGAILNTDIKAAAGIPYSKLSLADSIVNADVNSAAAIALTKLASFIIASAAIKGSDQQVTSSTVLVNDEALLLALAAGSIYTFHGRIAYNSGSTPDIKMAFTVPNGAAIYFFHIDSDLTTLRGYFTLTSGTSFIAQCTGNNQLLFIHGVVVTGATAGNLQFQFAQQTSNGGATKVLAFSTLIAEKVY